MAQILILSKFVQNVTHCRRALMHFYYCVIVILYFIAQSPVQNHSQHSVEGFCSILRIRGFLALVKLNC